MTIVEQGSGVYLLTFTAGERAMLARAARRYGVLSFKSALESWLQNAGGDEAEAEEVKRAFLQSRDAKARSDAKAALGVAE